MQSICTYIKRRSNHIRYHLPVNYSIYFSLRSFIMKWLPFGIQKQPPEMFCKKGVLINFAKFTGKHLCQTLFFNKVAGATCVFSRICYFSRPGLILLRRIITPHHTKVFLWLAVFVIDEFYITMFLNRSFKVIWVFKYKDWSAYLRKYLKFDINNKKDFENAIFITISYTTVLLLNVQLTKISIK